jgi:hypothetical protein
MMQDNTPINFYIKHFFINCQIKKLQPIFDTFVPLCMYNNNGIYIYNNIAHPPQRQYPVIIDNRQEKWTFTSLFGRYRQCPFIVFVRNIYTSGENAHFSLGAL